MVSRLFLFIFVTVFAVALPFSGYAQVSDPNEAIVKIYTIHNSPDYFNPWSMLGPQSSTGSGSIISGERILTNAHVVRDQTFIQVRRYGEAKRVRARVLNISHDADLAILTVEDKDFFKGVSPLGFGDLPKPQQEVVVYGFPTGGDTLSTTKGVVSRIEHQVYAHSSIRLLAGQIDAAINPGNSGGPVMVGKNIVGVVMQSARWADGIGYMVPIPVIQHFLKDIKDGAYNGFPSLGVIYQNLENDDLRRYHNVPEGKNGVLVTHVIPGSAVDSIVVPGDAITAVGGNAVANDGTVEFRKNERTDLNYYVQQHQIGESVKLSLLRQGQALDVSIKMEKSVQDIFLIPMEEYDTLPTYFIYGGIVFTPVTKSLLKGLDGKSFTQVPGDITGLLRHNYPEAEGEEVVVILKVLSTEANEGYDRFAWWIVNEVNGEKVNNLRELVKIVEEETDKPFVVFRNKHGSTVVLDRNKATQSSAEILETYRISSDRSPDLQTSALQHSIGQSLVNETR